MKLIRILLILLVGLFGAIAYHTYNSFRAFQAQAYTGNVISKTRTFVERNSGKWPTSWSDIGETDDANRYVAIDFTLTSEQIRLSPNRIYTAIQPRHVIQMSSILSNQLMELSLLIQTNKGAQHVLAPYGVPDSTSDN